MQSTRPIRALTRGLDALTVLNSRDGTTVSEVAHEVRLPRTTVYRILETFCDAGFVFRDADDRYRVTNVVRGLSEGVEDEPWITQIAMPRIDQLGADISWPVSLATPSGMVMMLRQTTDHHAPLLAERYSAGFRLPMLTSSAGRAYLAFCQEPQRDSLVEALGLARADIGELQRLLAEIESQGYASMTRTRRLAEETSLSVPVMLPDRILCVLTVRFASAALPAQTAAERFLPKLRQCAAEIAQSMHTLEMVA